MWFKVDDGFYSSRKVIRIPRGKRWSAIGLWLLAGTWCADNTTDGHIQHHELDELGGRQSDAKVLVEVGLWEVTPDGYVFHDWADYQPTKAQVTEQRQIEAERKRLYRESKRNAGVRPDDVPDVSVWDNDGTPDGQNTESGYPDPTRPDPTRPVPEGTSGEVADATSRPEIQQLLDLLDAEIDRNGGKVPSRSKKNIDAIRLLLDRDGKTVEQVAAAIRWCQADEFWRSNILSASKLREKYETIRLQAKRSHPSVVDHGRKVDEILRGRQSSQLAVGA